MQIIFLYMKVNIFAYFIFRRTDELIELVHLNDILIACMYVSIGIIRGQGGGIRV